MGIRENKVEKYLDTKIVELGGITRKWVSPGVDGVPDRIVVWDGRLGEIVFAEVKTWDGVLEDHQIREQSRLRDAGCTVTTIYGNTGVAKFIHCFELCFSIKSEYR